MCGHGVVRDQDHAALTTQVFCHLLTRPRVTSKMVSPRDERTRFCLAVLLPGSPWSLPDITPCGVGASEVTRTPFQVLHDRWFCSPLHWKLRTCRVRLATTTNPEPPFGGTESPSVSRRKFRIWHWSGTAPLWCADLFKGSNRVARRSSCQGQGI